MINVPTCGSSSTANVSPALKVSLGFRAAPTPGGVPVKINVPAGRVVPWLRKLTIFGTLKMRSLFENVVS